MERKLQKTCPTYHNLLITLDLKKYLVSSLSNLVNNVAEGIHKIKCKYEDNDKKCETCGIKYKDCDCFLEYNKL